MLRLRKLSEIYRVEDMLLYRGFSEVIEQRKIIKQPPKIDKPANGAPLKPRLSEMVNLFNSCKQNLTRKLLQSKYFSP